MKWIFCVLIGIATACVGIFIDFFVKELTEGKFDMLAGEPAHFAVRYSSHLPHTCCELCMC
jgi:hypothetical protein